MTEGTENKRRAGRQPVLKSAKIHFVHSVVDCLIVDLSAVGMRISTELPVVFPEVVCIELRTGAMWNSARRWQRGLEAGFEFLQFAGLNLDASARALELYSELRASSVREVTERLAREGYYDNPALRDAAGALAVAYDKLNEVFRDILKLR